MGLSPERVEIIDFLPALTINPSSAMVKYPVLETDVAGFVKTFTVEVSSAVKI